jgi:hypothetical protein
MEIDINTVITVGSILVTWGTATGYLKAKIDALTRQVEKQNGNVAKLQEWSLHHVEDAHANR